MSDFELSEEGPREAFDHLEDYLVIDVRAEFETLGPLGRVPGAERIERAGFHALAARGVERPLLIVCRSGRRSAAACEALAELGVRDVTNLAGGMIAWNQSGLPVERTRASRLEDISEGLVRWLSMVTQTPVDDVRRDLGLAAEQAPTISSIESALAVTHERFAGENAPPDLDYTIAAFRDDLEAIATRPRGGV